MKSVIKMITPGLPMDGEYYIVGTDGVTEIRDDSIEWESSVDFIYTVYKGENKVNQWVNVPVKITYFESEV